MPPKGRTPAPPPRRRPRVAGRPGGPRPDAPVTEQWADPPEPAGESATPAYQQAEPAPEPAPVPAPAARPVPVARQAQEPGGERPEPSTVATDARQAQAEPARKAPDPALQGQQRRHTGIRPAAATPQTPQPPDAAPAARAEPAPARLRRLGSLQAIAFFVMVMVVFAVAAIVFRGEAGRASTGSADNRALVDRAATTEVIGQVSKAIEIVLSYDYTKLDENEKAGQDVIDGKYAEEFAKTFADIRRVSPDQKLTVTTTVLLAGVTSLGEDRAEIIATMDVAAVRDTTPYTSPGRVKVTATRIDGRWKIAEMTLL